VTRTGRAERARRAGTFAALAAIILVAFPYGSESATSRAQPAGPFTTDAAYRDEAEGALSRRGDGASGTSDTACADTRTDAQIVCVLTRRFESDEPTQRAALLLYARHGIAVGVEHAHTMDGGFRGQLEIVPEWPLGRHARHVRWVLAAHDEIERVLVALRARAGANPVRYRHTNLVYRFMRSVGRTTPSAYASGFTIGYNVSGSLHRSAAAVHSTLTHEVFHLNDEVRPNGPDDRWSVRNLTDLHSRIVARCGTARRCLAPYAPTRTAVRGGTYYSFQPGNGDAVVEYGAEIATRYLEEQGAMIDRGRLAGSPWKCATPENEQAYRRVAEQFFGGVDLTPSCRR
jgi:hypothetical protein